MKTLQLGHLVNTSVLRLHTYKAQSLVDGKAIVDAKHEGEAKYSVPSIKEVGHRINTIWECAKKDDPYADLVLLEIERLITRACDNFLRAETLLSERVKKMQLPDELSLHIGAAKNSSEMPLDHPAFRSTHCKQLILLIARFDHFMRTVMTYQEFGLISVKRASTIERGTRRAIRGAMMAALRFRYTGVTRRDLSENNPLAQSAIEKMGALPHDILTRERQPKWGSGVVHNTQ